MNATMLASCFESRGPKCRIPASLPPESAIAGRGAVYPFAVFSALCLVGTILLIICRQYLLKIETPKKFAKLGIIGSAFIFSTSTAQLTTSIAYTIAALLPDRTLSVYHYNIICYLGITALFTSTASMLAPYSHVLKAWSTIVRFILIVMLLILLGLLLGPRFAHFRVFPGRSPLNGNPDHGTALVLQASCLLDLKGPLNSRDCAFPNDRKPIWVVSDVLVVIPFTLLGVAVGSVCTIWGSVESGSLVRFKPSLRMLVAEISLVLFAAVWVSLSLWQCFDLRNWMNSSGLLADKSELSLSTFGAVVPFFMMIGTLLLVTGTTFDEMSQRDTKKKELMAAGDDDEDDGIELERPVVNRVIHR